jgi:hypothetical protein
MPGGVTGKAREGIPMSIARIYTNHKGTVGQAPPYRTEKYVVLKNLLQISPSTLYNILT